MSNISNDSGLEDSAINSVANPAATRMSWFLAEADEGSLRNGEPNGRSALCVLHSMELLEADASDKYMTRFVEFRLNNVVLEAKLILAADERKLVDAALLAMSKERRDTSGPQLLVQYHNEAGERLVHQLVPRSHVTWLSTQREMAAAPLVKLVSGHIARVLHSHEERDYMEKALLHLKAGCFDATFDEQPEGQGTPAPMDDNTWLLVQFSPDPEQANYQIIKYSQTVWQQENLFKDVIAYIQLPDFDLVLQAIVISYSQDRAVLLRKLDELQCYATALKFPQPSELESPQGGSAAALFTRSTLFHRVEKRDVTGEHRRLRQSLDKMNENAQQEAQMIIDAFELVENLNKKLETQVNEGSAAS